MIGATIRRSLMVCAVAIGLALTAVPSYAQTGQLKGKVVDKDNKPVDGAQVLIENQDGAGQKLTTKTDKKGGYIQIGLTPGNYRVTVTKGDLSAQQKTHVGLDMVTLDFTLAPGGQMSKDDQAKVAARLAAVRAKFDEGVALSNAGKDDEAIAKFQEITVDVPKCAECFANIGTIYARKKDYDNAEKAFKQAIEVRPDFAEAYNGLATVYNAQKKFDQAAEAGAQAAKLSSAPGPGGTGGGASASATFNQGVILWNAQKIPEAKAKFEEAVKLDPKLADAHYWLGMSLINEGKLPEAKPHFEEYLKLAPTGQYAEQAKGVIAQIK